MANFARMLLMFLLWVALPVGVSRCVATLQDSTRGLAAQGRASNFPVPKECADVDVAKLGQPLLSADSGLVFGISVGPQPTVDGAPVPLYLWIVNMTDQPHRLMTCTTTQWLGQDGFNVYDERGGRLAKRDKERRPTACPWLLVCSMNMRFTVPAHSCSAGQQGNDLTKLYSMPPGKYRVRFVDPLRCVSPPSNGEPKEVPGQLPITIVPE